MDKIQFFCLNYNNDERKINMKMRFAQLDIECTFMPGVDFTDNRISNYHEILDNGTKRVWSCMYGHLDMIHMFYCNTNKEYGIFCEDDIFIHKNIKNYLPRICFDFNALNLDVLLLGYLLQDRVSNLPPNFQKEFPIKFLNDNKSPFIYHSFPEYLWGAQMYMLSRKHAKFLLDKYMKGYSELTIQNKDIVPFSADWTLTKDGNRALISPILVVEDNSSSYDDIGQKSFHKQCFDSHYEDDLFVV
uniref:Glycosyl transferase family 25 domain-containing protein n=1 Tax=viral metagenome TaxID=1070528 RepID=A0A6C0DJD3_9ZZZZ